MIFYIGYYDCLTKGKYLRDVSPAAVRKMDYVISKILEHKNDLTIVSPAVSFIDDKASPFHSSDITLENGAKLVLAPSIKCNNRYIRSFTVRAARLWLKGFIHKYVKANDTVLFYDSPELMRTIISSQKKIGYKLVLEIEEIYSKVWNIGEKKTRIENQLFDLYKENSIVVSELIAKELEIEHSVVSYGSYVLPENVCKTTERNGLITLLYSGEIEKVRGSAFNAIEIMNYLPDTYRLVISGKVSEGAKKEFIDKIDHINMDKGYDAIVFKGLLSSEEYHQLLCDSDIALNLQNNGSFSGFLFPSKILTYLSYNLPVVTTPGESITNSKLSQILYITKDYKCQSMVEKIEDVDTSQKKNYSEIIKELDLEFSEGIKRLLFE